MEGGRERDGLQEKGAQTTHTAYVVLACCFHTFYNKKLKKSVSLKNHDMTTRETI